VGRAGMADSGADEDQARGVDQASRGKRKIERSTPIPAERRRLRDSKSLREGI